MINLNSNDILKCWLTFDHLNISYFDCSFNNHSGTLNGNTTNIDGYINNAVSLNGNQASGSYIRVSHHTDLNPSSMTISLWAKPNSWNVDYMTIVSKYGNDPYPGWSLRRNPSNNLEAFAFVGNYAFVTTDALSTGVWTHISMVYDGTNTALSLYVNGVLKGSDSAPTGGMDTTTNDLLVGADVVAPTNRYFDGSIDDFRFYNQVLTDNEILALYKMNFIQYPQIIVI